MYQMNPTSLFSGKATDYAKYRPYPTEAIASLKKGEPVIPVWLDKIFEDGLAGQGEKGTRGVIRWGFKPHLITGNQNL